MANKIETSSKNIKPRINLNHNIYLSKVLEVSFFAIIAVPINVYFLNFYKSHYSTHTGTEKVICKVHLNYVLLFWLVMIILKCMLKQQYAAKVLETITKMVRHLLYRFDMTSFSPSSMFQQTLQLLVMQGSYGSWVMENLESHCMHGIVSLVIDIVCVVCKLSQVSK